VHVAVSGRRRPTRLLRVAAATAALISWILLACSCGSSTGKSATEVDAADRSKIVALMESEYGSSAYGPPEVVSAGKGSSLFAVYYVPSASTFVELDIMTSVTYPKLSPSGFKALSSGAAYEAQVIPGNVTAVTEVDRSGNEASVILKGFSNSVLTENEETLPMRLKKTLTEIDAIVQ
jgi:hypothetical protein